MNIASTRLFSKVMITAVCGLVISSFLYQDAAAAGTSVLHVREAEVREGEIDVNITVDADTAVSAVDIRVLHSSNLVLKDSNSEGSVFDQELFAPKTSAEGMVSFSRIRIDEGYTGEDGLVMKLTFSVVGEGNPAIQIDASDSEVIAFEDSSNVLQSADTFTEPVIVEMEPETEVGPMPVSVTDDAEGQNTDPITIFLIAGIIIAVLVALLFAAKRKRPGPPAQPK